MKTKNDKVKKKHSDDGEPPWMNPANDRKTPYSEEELREFSEEFMESQGDTAAVKNLIIESGKDQAKEIVKQSFKKRDVNDLENMSISDTKH